MSALCISHGEAGTVVPTKTGTVLPTKAYGKAHSSSYEVNVEEAGSNRLPCVACGRARRWPRNVAYAHIAVIPKDVQRVLGPSTKRTLVALVNAKPGTEQPNVCLPLFGKLELAKK